MARTQNARLMVVLLLVGAGCADMSSTEPRVFAGGVATAAKMLKAVACHEDPTAPGTYAALSLPEKGFAAHMAHGDSVPGMNVPGKYGYFFDERCIPVLARINLSGQWVGTYDWNCGGPVTVSTPIQFALSDSGAGRIFGTVAYLGGIASLAPLESYRLSDPTFRPDGRLFFGTMDPDGVTVRLTSNTGAAGHFVNNQFDGTLTDRNTISGHSLNGDSAGGCSAGTGYAGTFVVYRQPTGP